MKRASAYYCAIFGVANIIVGCAFGYLTRMVRESASVVLEGKPLPPLTEALAAVWWWPYVLAALFAAGLILSVATETSSSALCHAVIVLLVAEGFILFCALAAYSIPFMQMLTPAW